LKTTWPALDLLINNAGVGLGGEIGQLSLDDWHWIININLWGAIHGCHTMIDWMKQNPRGAHIVNVGSLAAVVSAPSMAPYTITKAGMVSLSESIYTEPKPHNITATVVCPAFVPTNIIKSGRFSSENQRTMAGKMMSASRLTPEALAERVMRAIE